MFFKTSPNTHRQFPLISRSSILILAGILIGLSWTEVFGSGLQSLKWTTVMAALVALLAFLVLDLLGRRRHREQATAVSQEALQQLEHRVERHMAEEFGEHPRGEPRRLT